MIELKYEVIVGAITELIESIQQLLFLIDVAQTYLNDVNSALENPVLTLEIL